MNRPMIFVRYLPWRSRMHRSRSPPGAPGIIASCLGTPTSPTVREICEALISSHDRSQREPYSASSHTGLC
jgi:hypothetical protein